VGDGLIRFGTFAGGPPVFTTFDFTTSRQVKYVEFVLSLPFEGEITLAQSGPNLSSSRTVTGSFVSSTFKYPKPLGAYNLLVIATANPAFATPATNSSAVGHYSVFISVVPLPPAGLLFLTALGGLAVLQFRQRSALSA
jgi:hypothetical protein